MKVRTKEKPQEAPAARGREVATVDAKMPALSPEWETKLAEAAKDEAATEQPQVQAFSLRAGVLSYNNQPMPGNKMDVVILAASFENAFFINKFDPNNIISPLCFALSEDGEDMEPHDNSYKKQHGVCVGCPQAEWGSDTNSPSGRGKACKETRRLAVMPATALEDGIEKATIAMLRVPVTSVANWSQYVHLLAATAKRPPWAVITEISLKPDPKKQFTVNFAPMGSVNNPMDLEKLHGARERALQAVLNPYGMMTEEQYKEIVAERDRPAKKAKY